MSVGVEMVQKQLLLTRSVTSLFRIISVRAKSRISRHAADAGVSADVSDKYCVGFR